MCDRRDCGPQSSLMDRHSNISTSLPPIINQELASDKLIMAITFSCCCMSAIFSVAGNSMVLWIICRTKTFRQSPTFMFIANICISDIFISTMVVPFQFQLHLLSRWVIPWFLCYACPTIQVVMVSNSVFTLTAIALERYRAVLHPLKTRLSKSKVKLEIGLIWVLSVLICIPTWVSLKVELQWDPITDLRTLAQCNDHSIKSALYGHYSTLLVFAQYFVPLCIISYTYLRMAIELNGHIPDIDRLVGKTQLCSRTVRQNKRKVVKMLFFVVCLFLVSWLPIQLVKLSRIIWPEVQQFRYFNVIKFACSWLALSSSSYNPYIYILYNERFRNQFRIHFSYVYFVFCSVESQQKEALTSSQIVKDNRNNLSY